MSKVKAVGSSKNGRDSQSKRLGVKIFGSQKIKTGQIIVKQVGMKWHNGKNVGVGRDKTLFALKDGVVRFSQKNKTAFTGIKKTKTFVEVI